MPRGGKRNGAGRKPKPRADVRVVSIPLAVVEGGAGVPPEPDWTLTFADELDIAIARQSWSVVIRELRDADKLSSANAHQIKRLVEAYVLYEKALRRVAEEGAVFSRRGKKQPGYNPWFTVLKDMGAVASAIEAELTLTPRRRNNGGKVQKKKPSAIGGGYLRAVPK